MDEVDVGVLGLLLEAVVVMLEDERLLKDADEGRTVLPPMSMASLCTELRRGLDGAISRISFILCSWLSSLWH